jgi:hypothetical protein
VSYPFEVTPRDNILMMVFEASALDPSGQVLSQNSERRSDVLTGEPRAVDREEPVHQSNS